MDKTKITQAATKYVQKGQYDKAIAEYRRILEKDPKDVRILLKIGELQQKKGENEAAAGTLLDVANSYANDGFFLKAVAVFKQVLKLSPERVDVTLRLADLYQQLGLMSDAMAQLQAAAAHFEKAESIGQSVEILRRMVSLEPENLAFRLRLADLLARQENTQEALQELRRAMEKLRGGSRIEDWLRVGDRIVRLDPKDQTLGRELAHAYLAKNDVRRALERLQVCFQEDPKNAETLELLARAFVGVGQRAKAASVYKELARVHRERSRGADEQTAWRKVLEVAPDDAEAQHALGGFAQPAGRPAAPPRIEPSPAGIPVPVARSAGPVPPAFHRPEPSAENSGTWTTAPRPEASQPGAVRAEGSWPGARSSIPRPEASQPGAVRAEGSWPGARSAVPRPEASQPSARSAVPRPAPEASRAAPEAGDPSQLARLLTETDVFVKYGLAEKARLHLQKIFAIDPDNVAAHEKAVAMARSRDAAELHDALASLARACAKAGDFEHGRPAFDELRAAAPAHADLPALAQAYAGAPQAHAVSDDLILEGGTGPIDFVEALPGGDEPLILPLAPGEEAVEIDPALAPPYAPVNEDALFALASDPFEQTDDVIDEPLLGDPDAAGAAQAAAFALLDRDEQSRGPADEQTIGIDTDADTAGPPPPEQTVDLLIPDLPEGDEELTFDDPEAPTRAAPAIGVDASGARTELALLPDDEVLGLTPIARHVTDETDQVNFDAPTAEHEALGDAVQPANRPAEPGLAPEARPSVVAQDPVNPWRVGEGEVDAIVAELDEAEFYLQQGMLDEAEELFRAIERRVPGHAQATSRLAEIAARRGGPAPQQAPAEAEEGGLFDLGAALAQELGDVPFGENDAPLDLPAQAGQASAKTEDVGTHYDLALAYKEMGLLAEAIAEFEKALAGCPGTPRAIECLTMIGLCHVALGDAARAIESFGKGLEEPDAGPDVQKALHYEIALAFEAAGDLDEALASYGRVARIDGTYRDVRGAITRLVAAGVAPRPLEPSPAALGLRTAGK